ncbi:hypothetical protein [Methylosinus sp. Ce-a6]|uniref:hypothetical protein n=1 Tax=Methylosinus sp. Ce-a6 TaxID=2172005 RepID=UPI00135797CB|nr:hypothetical protein [Methylosinus sp. Ce-a6]
MTIQRFAAVGLAAALSSAPSVPAYAQADGFFVPDRVGLLAAAPYSYLYRYPAPYPYVYARNGCLVNAAVFDGWGAFVGYQRLRVAC